MPKSVFTDPYSAVLAALVEARQKAGLTQAQLAERLGKPQSFVSKAERGERRIDVVEFCDFADAIGVQPVVLFKQAVDGRPTNPKAP